MSTALLPQTLGRILVGRALGLWRALFLAAQVLVLVLTPGSYDRRARAALAQRVYLDTAPILLWFTLLAALLSLVLTRIVVVTALSYGLSQYALQMVIRVLVLELIPLTAALFVALRLTLAHGVDLRALRLGGEMERLRALGREPLRELVLPRVLAGVFATLTLAALSCVVASLLAYLAVYGFTLAGLDGYTRVFGQVFNPAVSLIFLLKTLFLSLAVSLIPMVAALQDGTRRSVRSSAEMRALVYMFVAIVLLEGVSLVGNYY